jgi:hypothetical protein
LQEILSLGPGGQGLPRGCALEFLARGRALDALHDAVDEPACAADEPVITRGVRVCGVTGCAERIVAAAAAPDRKACRLEREAAECAAIAALRALPRAVLFRASAPART